MKETLSVIVVIDTEFVNNTAISLQIFVKPESFRRNQEMELERSSPELALLFHKFSKTVPHFLLFMEEPSLPPLRGGQWGTVRE
jgi:hypothetical protein